ncbi:MAG: hypothetical protein Q8N14_06180 [Candidatus Omnitrophota bacterium]|nr:hypothetical protein [Candidatus Omnitrophota bacterium]
MNIKSRIKRLEEDICPPDRKYGALIHSYRHNCINPPAGWNNYMREGKPIGYISSVLEWANGKLGRMIKAASEEGKKILKGLGYKKISEDHNKQE